MKKRNSMVLVMFIVSISQEEINVSSTAFRYQLPLAWPASFNGPALLEKE